MACVKTPSAFPGPAKGPKAPVELHLILAISNAVRSQHPVDPLRIGALLFDEVGFPRKRSDRRPVNEKAFTIIVVVSALAMHMPAISQVGLRQLE